MAKQNRECADEKTTLEASKNDEKSSEKLEKKRSKTLVSMEKTTESAGKMSQKRGVEELYATKILPYLSDIERYASCGVLEGQLAAYYHVGKTSWAKYKKEHPEFAETLNRAIVKARTALINRSFEVAMGYDYTETVTVTTRDKAGKETGSKTTVRKCHAKADAGMLQFLLINRIPEDFARDPQAIALRRRALELAAEGRLSLDTEVL